MSQEECISKLSEYLFWDIDKSQLDIDVSSSYMIRRVLEYGQLEDWFTIQKYYGLDKIVEDCKNMRTLDPKALAFVAGISNTSRSDYRCYKNPNNHGIR